MVGRILYDESHVRTLGWTDVTPEARRGVVVIIKPGVDTTDLVDVLQYGRANDAFPQQTTADQWFDEAQFESYRRLGVHSLETICGAGVLDEFGRLAPPAPAGPRVAATGATV